MKGQATRVLLRSVLKPFYRENGGLILFLLFIMFAAVGHNNGVGLREYHHQLILGMLRRTDMLLIVVSAWVLYGLRGMSLVRRLLRDPAFSFLAEYARLRRIARYPRLLLIQCIVLLPVLIYSVIILCIAWRLHLYARVAGLSGILAGLSFGAAAWYSVLFSDPTWCQRKQSVKKTGSLHRVRYWHLLLRFLLTQKKMLLLFVKLFSVTMLVAVLQSLSPAEADLRMPVLFFSFGLFGHGVLLFHCREMEETGLNFYRGLPVSLLRRFAGYLIFYSLVFLPETGVMIRMMPAHISPANGFLFYSMGTGVLLLMNSILFIQTYSRTQFLKICCAIYLLIFAAVLSGVLPFVVVAIILTAVFIFVRSYYRFEAG